MKSVFVLAITLSAIIGELSFAVGTELGKAAVDPNSKYKLRPLAYADVKLHGDLQRQFDEVCDYYYKIPNDNLLKPYRQRAGLPAPGDDMGGVYAAHGPFGQYLGGYARMYAATKDEKYRQKAVALMEGWAKTIEPDGFFFTEKTTQLTAYQYEKMLGGLLDVYYFCGNADALKYLDRITSWEENNMPRTRVYGDVVGKSTGEWYTQSENLYRAYLYTGEKRYKDFAEVWEYTEWWNEILGGNYDAIYKRIECRHAYSHLNSFNGLAAAYIVKGEDKYLDTLKKAYDFMQNEQCFATGGSGPNECMLCRTELVKMLEATDRHCETQCNSWAGFKMTKYLIELTGNAKYADWTEKIMLNMIGASIPVLSEGYAFYYSEYRTTGSKKRYHPTAAWTCCTGTRAEAVPDYHNLLYFVDGDSIYVSQYFASEASTRIGESNVTIVQETTFPEEEVTKLAVTIDKPAQFNVKFRIPAWLASKAVAKVNGNAVDYTIDNNWGVIANNWKSGDLIELKLPMKLDVSKMDASKEYPAAIMYGPVVLAVKDIAGVQNPASLIDLDRISETFKRSAAGQLIWTMPGNDSVVMKPFYSYKQGEKYFLYLDKNAVFTPEPETKNN